jgi:ribosomal protein S18 acetylase RimI-like enzyme
MDVEIRRLGSGDEQAVLAAEHLFDKSLDADATRRFLTEPTHHLLLAYDADDHPVGYVSGVETTHPDKGTELFLYELAVDEPIRRQGIGRALVQAFAELARERGCYGMWVLADADNDAAQATYTSAGAAVASQPVMLEWDTRGAGP